MASGEWGIGNEEWGMGNGKWQMANGEWQGVSHLSFGEGPGVRLIDPVKPKTKQAGTRS